MAGAEILLLAIGTVFFIVSFFIAERLGPGELDKIGEMSNEEIQRIMERELLKVTADIEGRVEEKASEALERSERSMERECNEKIMAISEYSDTIVESMNKTHNEIMFLYSMLNDKHSELTDLSSKLQGLAGDLKKQDEEIADRLARRVEEEMRMPEWEEPPQTMEIREEAWTKEAKDPEEGNHNMSILSLHKAGKDALTIARELGLGLGEVQLVIGLYEGKRK